MEFQNLIFEKIDGVARITLNRPEVKNALNVPLLKDIAAAIQDIKADESIKALIITATGDVFSSGGDVDFVYKLSCDQSPMEIREVLLEHYGAAALSLRTLNIPVIGAFNGAVMGAGFDFSLHMDFRLASEKAIFGSIWIRIATIPALGGMFLLPKIIGLTKATEMMMTGDTIDAQEAYRVGLINRIVPADQLQDEAMNLARRFTKSPKVAMSIIKQGIIRGLSGTLMSEVDWAVYMQAIAINAKDCQEGIRAFKERRKANFQGK
ncbi:MAG: enoyl-CoA hydratase/isomerase family protein [Desulfobaccales bacterium]